MKNTTHELLLFETDFLDAHRTELQTKYGDQYLLIKETEVVDDFKKEAEAIVEGVQRFRSEPFLVRRAQDETETFDIPALSLGLL